MVLIQLDQINNSIYLNVVFKSKILEDEKWNTLHQGGLELGIEWVVFSIFKYKIVITGNI